MATKEQIKQAATTEGIHYIEKDSSYDAKKISSFRSRLWQAAKRNGMKVSCSIEGDKFIIKTSRG